MAHNEKMRIICTTMIQGAKDNGLFEKVVRIQSVFIVLINKIKVVRVYKERFEDVDSCYYHHNMNNVPYCTHLRFNI